MTAGVRRRLRPTSAAPLDDDDLLDEILLRLSPDPSSLPRASAVCTRWRGLVSDPDFVRRFRLRHRHRRSAPILGCFITDLQTPTVSFVPTLEAPNRVPAERFSLQFRDGHRDRLRLLNCRHGILLIYLPHRKKILVWDPVTGDQRCLYVPLEFVMMEDDQIDGAVLRPAGSTHHFHFQVVLLRIDEQDRRRAIACVYSSEAGAWGDLISALLPDEVPADFSFMCAPAVLVGDSFHWLVTWGLPVILEFDLHRQILSVIPLPVDMLFVMRADDDGGLGVLLMSGCNVHLWKRKIDCDGEASWVLTRTVELDRLLSLNSEQKQSIWMLGFAEYNNVVLVWTAVGHFMIQLESLQFKKTFETNIRSLQPFESVYTGGGIGGGQSGAGLLHNT